MRQRFALIFGILFSQVGFASDDFNGRPISEPSFCQPTTFFSKEISSSGNGLRRLHLFKIGKMNLAGLAVGGSNPTSVKALASKHSTAGGNDRYCTWYFNDGNTDAKRSFVWKYVSKPVTDPQQIVEEYESVLGSSFDQESTNFVQCAENFNYIAMGCDGMMHRGPTVFAMLLAFTGCTPEHSTEIADKLWGLNGVPLETRLAVAKKGFEIGNAHSESRAKLVQLFSE